MSTDPDAATPGAEGSAAPGADGTAVTPEVSVADEPHEAQEAAGGVTLGARDRDVLAFERQWWRYGGAKEEAIRERFGLSATRYYQVLNAVIDRPEALATDPLLVRRLRRVRSARQRQRSGRVLGSEGRRS
ncbi:DUF3263 domain-containing protein [Modestobacter sp. NPDC049651]|uniref:DUF3263 domain-containing protein n=1 Tax=unclassified Modestobacter TaxID=2643866 RepID=UPI0033FA13E5